MDIAIRKRELMDWLTLLKDEAKLEKLFAFKATLEDEIIAYNAVGEPLNIEQYNAEIDKGLQDMKEGRVISQEELFKKMQNW